MITKYDINNPVALNEGSVLLDFQATWCGPCRMTGKYLEKYSESHPNLNIISIDVDESEELTEKYGVQNLPCIIYMEDGEVQWRHVGLMTDKHLEEKLGC